MNNDPSGLDGLDDLSGLHNESKLPHLSKTIDHETDIAPHPFIRNSTLLSLGTYVQKCITRDYAGIPSFLLLHSHYLHGILQFLHNIIFYLAF